MSEAEAVSAEAVVADAAPNPDPMSPIEAALIERMNKIEEAQATLEDAWLHFSQSGTEAIEECQRIVAAAAVSDSAELDRRLKIIEASRV